MKKFGPGRTFKPKYQVNRMNRISSRLSGVVLVTMALLALPFTAVAEDEPDSFLISLNSAEGQVQGMALELATKLAQRDKEVMVLLCGDAGDLALEENIPSALRPRDISPKEMMLEAASLGATVKVCHLYLPNSGFRQYDVDDLVEEVTEANAEDIAEYMLKPRVRTFSY